MDPTLAQTNPTPPPPQHSSSSSYTSFPILAISILGILTTSIFLVSYYVFVIKCCLNLRRSDLLLLRLSRSRRHLRHPNPPPLHSPNSRGLDTSSIRSIPTFRFTKTTRNSDVECAVCLTDFQESELLRLLPNCSHAFHIDCIDTWLQSHANCPLCRSNITITLPIHHFSTPQPSERDVVLIDIGSGDQTPTRPTPKSTSKVGRKFWHVTSMGDEWIDTRGKDERFVVQPIRRSFSMDSSNDRQLCVSVQEILQQQHPNIYPEVGNGEASSSGGSGRIRRSFFSFGRSAWSTALIPLQSD